MANRYCPECKRKMTEFDQLDEGERFTCSKCKIIVEITMMEDAEEFDEFDDEDEDIEDDGPVGRGSRI